MMRIVYQTNCLRSNKLPASPAPSTRKAPRAADRRTKARRDAAPALGILPELLGYQLRLAQRAIFDDFAQSMAGLEVSPGLFGLLVIVEANPGLKQTELANAAQLDRSSLVPALDKLEERGWVARRASEHDRRVNGLWLTDTGAIALRQLKERVLSHERRLARHLSAADRQRFIELLGRIFPELR
jgi:DNA-binding MarR family transcriptional regulator